MRATCRSKIESIILTRRFPQWLWIVLLVRCIVAARRFCSFCVDRVEHIDYKDLPRLRKYVSERAKIIPRRVTGTCAFHQRELTVAIKRARYMALMPYVSD